MTCTMCTMYLHWVEQATGHFFTRTLQYMTPVDLVTDDFDIALHWRIATRWNCQHIFIAFEMLLLNKDENKNWIENILLWSVRCRNIIDEHYNFLGPLESSGSKTSKLLVKLWGKKIMKIWGKIRKVELLHPPPRAVRLATPLENLY